MTDFGVGAFVDDINYDDFICLEYVVNIIDCVGSIKQPTTANVSGAYNKVGVSSGQCYDFKQSS